MSPEVNDAGSEPENPWPEYSFDRLLVRKASFELVERAERAAGEQRPDTILTAVNLRRSIDFHESKTRGLVNLKVIAIPDAKWQPYRIEVIVSGVFGSKRATAEIFDDFCQNAAPSILFPYARQIIHNLTADAPNGPVRISPLYVQSMFETAADNVRLQRAQQEGMAMLTDDELAAIERRLKYLDGEFWSLNPTNKFLVDTGSPMPLIQGGLFTRDEYATFIANAPHDIRKLLEELKRLRVKQ